MRGDRPCNVEVHAEAIQFTPHARGSTLQGKNKDKFLSVYPACAGIDPEEGKIAYRSKGLPRMRGDRPAIKSKMVFLDGFTPHARGSTGIPYPWKNKFSVYPACAGIDPSAQKSDSILISLPRMRGDRPIPERVYLWLPEFTPHARGSTSVGYCQSGTYTVYPACAGIDHRR